MLASYHGHVALTRLLLEHGADPNILNDKGQSPLAGAVFKNEEEIVRVLLEGVSAFLLLSLGFAICWLYSSGVAFWRGGLLGVLR